MTKHSFAQTMHGFFVRSTSSLKMYDKESYHSKIIYNTERGEWGGGGGGGGEKKEKKKLSLEKLF